MQQNFKVIRQERMRWLDGIINTLDMSLSKPPETVKDREAWHAAVHRVAKNWTWLSDWTTICVLKSEIQLFSWVLITGQIRSFNSPTHQWNNQWSLSKLSWKTRSLISSQPLLDYDISQKENIDRWMNKEDVVYIYTMEYYSLIKRMKMDLEIIILSEVRQRKYKYHMTSLTCGI